MNTIVRNILFGVMFLALAISCTVMSSQVRKEAISTTPFKTLIESSELYLGKTVILGGYIIQTENKTGDTIIKVLQTPLDLWETPTEVDKSEGRFIVLQKGYLDPVIYSKGRRITVAGSILGVEKEDIASCPNKCLKIESREIYLWPEYKYRDTYPYYYPYGRYPYYWRNEPYYYHYRGYPYYWDYY